MKLGQIVLSKCGRDKNKYFIVIGIDQNEEYIYLADGLVRKIDKPKKKKIRHVFPIDIDEELSTKLYNDAKICNSELKKLLSSVYQTNGRDFSKVLP